MYRVSCLALALSLFGGAEVDPFPGYTWERVGEGIYVHRPIDPLAGPVDGNSTVIIDQEGVVVVDTHINPAAARAVVESIRVLTDRPVTHVINTHWHDDHTNGNHTVRTAFPGARIVAHRETAGALEREWAAMEDQRRTTYESVRGRDILGAAESVEADDPLRATELRVFAGYRDALEPELPDLELAYPDLIADDGFVIERARRRIVLRWLGRGNTEGDLVVHLPDDGIVVAGDLVVAPVPYAFDVPMVDWVATLARLDRLDAPTLIPGHGPVTHDSEYLVRLEELLRRTLAEVREAHDAGVGYRDLSDSIDLAEHEALFTDGDPARTYAWRTYFLAPGLQSAWTSLGFEVPDGVDRPENGGSAPTR